MEPKEIQGKNSSPKFAYICPSCSKRFIENSNQKTKRLQILGLFSVLPALVAFHYESIVAAGLGAVIILGYVLYAQRQRNANPQVYAKYQAIDE